MTPPGVDVDEQFRTAFLYSSIGIALVGLDGRWLKVNPAACDLLGYSEAELLTRTFQDLTFPEDLETDLAHVAQLVAGEIRHYRLEKRYVHQDGHLVPVLLSVSLVHGAGGEPHHFVSQLQDISETKRAEEALRTAERRFRAIFNNTFQLIGLLAPDGKLLEANETALRFSGQTADEVVGRPFWDVPWWAGDAEARERLRTAVARAAGGEFVRYEATVRGPSGRLHTMDFSLKPVFDERGEVVLIIPESRDISDRAALEAQLRQAQKMEAVGRLAGGIAHDFNNLLSVITTESSLILSDSITQAHREGVEEIFQAAQRGAALTRQLLAFGRRQILQPRFVQINALVSGVTRLLRRVIGEDISLALDLSAPLGRIRVDPGQLEQALLNLTINSRDAMPAGGTISIETENVLGAGDRGGHFRGVMGQPYVAVRVRDTGTGIAPANLPHIFDPFFTTKDTGRGSGLGLSMVYGFVDQSTGFVEVESQVGRGTTVTLHFPVRELPADSSDPGDEPLAAPHGSETILLVEDEPPVRRATRRLLERYGYAVLEAESAEAALEVWSEASERIAMLLTDCMMPGMQGPALASRLREERPSLRAALMTGYVGQEGDRRMEEPPADMLFIQKPFLATTFLRLIRNELDRQSGDD